VKGVEKDHRWMGGKDEKPELSFPVSTGRSRPLKPHWTSLEPFYVWLNLFQQATLAQKKAANKKKS
jgi:hypothetical protein